MRVLLIWLAVSMPLSVAIGLVASLSNHQRKRDR